MPTDQEAAILELCCRENGFEPRTEADQLIASGLMNAGLLSVRGEFVKGKPVNKTYATFLGAWALAGWAGRRSELPRKKNRKAKVR